MANIFLSASDGGLNIQRAVTLRAFTSNTFRTRFCRTGLSACYPHALKGMGYAIKGRAFGDRYWSDGECIAVDPKTGLIEGGQDKRHTFGKAAGLLKFPGVEVLENTLKPVK